MEMESNQQQLIEALDNRRSFAQNKFNYTIFYVSSGATVCMFIIILVLLSYSVHIGEDIHALTTKGNIILDDIQELLPIVKKMCVHENFTNSYGNICNE
tara:strand:+ start:760 stop:1056 length:297 start_codon:yes stop_codon:yes gene_type:complete